MATTHAKLGILGHFSALQDPRQAWKLVYPLPRLRTGHGRENMAIVKHIGLNVMRSTKATASLKVRRKKVAWNTRYLRRRPARSRLNAFERFSWAGQLNKERERAITRAGMLAPRDLLVW